jgi:hypothetical protein
MPASFRLLAALATLSLTAACGTTRVQTKDLAGDWSSPTCEAIPNGDGSNSYVQRNFQLTEEAWTLKLDAFGDAGCSFKLFTARVGGPYTLEKDSEKVAGATEGNFALREQAFTAHVQDLATMFANAKCGTREWKVGEEQSTASTGCLFFRPTSACGMDHDVVKVEGNQLFFGARPADNDMCTADKRPTALAPLPVVKR